MKKLVLILTALALVAVLAACGGPEDSANAPRDSANAPEAPPREEPQEETPEAPEDVTLRLTVPKMAEIEDDEIPYTRGDEKQALHDHAGIHLEDTGHP